MPRLVSAPNLVSLSRVVVFAPLAVCLVAAGRQAGAVAALIVFGATDGVDGWLARRGKQVTRLGAALDVGADRIGVTVIVAGLAGLCILPVWMPATIIGADMVLAVAALVQRSRVPTAQVTRLGKIRTALLMTGLPVLVATTGALNHWAHTAAIVLLTLGCLAHVAAAAVYIRRLVRHSTNSQVRSPPAGIVPASTAARWANRSRGRSR